ncbi:MAG: M23 family metallopeptidase [Spirochaetales bacterium]
MKEGETLYGISRRFKVPLKSILEANEISDPTKVRAGTDLIIPHLYVVQKGDTLYGIARKMGIKVDTLLALNDLTPQVIIKPGDTLYVPGRAEDATPKDPGKSNTDIQVAEKKKEDIPSFQSGNPTSSSQGSTVSPREHSPHSVYWPHPGSRKELTGKLEGISFKGKAGDPVYSVSSGKVAWVGPYRGFGKVVIIQSDQGYLYVYAGNESIDVEPGEVVEKGQRIGTLGVNPYNQTPDLYFLVYKDGKPVRPEEAPRI